ncbi:ABC transporter ATP-binding protein [Anaerorhabdus sp.]|uniref:ABC transporter ATP-binding protein n=1 Tax=Anaerorhabdus sp. TaxID=1872524 RepID=UPI002FC61081
MDDIILSLKEITKVYDNGVFANRKVSIDFKKGEIHSVVGENGAGKSTIMKIAFGMEKPSEGQIVYKGQNVSFENSMEAIKLGIGMVHQHFMLIPSFTVAQSIVLGNEPVKNKFFIDYNQAMKKASELAKKYNFEIDVKAKIETLSVGAKQKVEILKTLYQDAEVIILDEPTAVLTPQETDALFIELKKFKELGHTVIFISHKLNEVKQISDRITIMKNGESCGTYDAKDISIEKMTELIVGRELSTSFEDIKKKLENTQAVLSVENLEIKTSKKHTLHDINFSVRTGEILGIAGVQGNGQSELIQAIAGMGPFTSGTIRLNNEDISTMPIKLRRQKGLAYIPEDRMKDGIAANASISDNIISTYYDQPEVSGKFFMKNKSIKSIADGLISKFSIKTSSGKTKIGSLSGGNIQKVVVAREYQTDPQLLIAEQPTRGIDIGSANFIHNQLIDLRNEGRAILLVSADLTEVMDLSDKLLVMYDGEIVAYFENTRDVTDKDLGLYMLGVKKQSDEEIRRAYRV